jgi:hypothetical protein
MSTRLRVYTRAQLGRIARRQESCRQILRAMGFEYSPRPIFKIRFSWSSTTPSTTLLRRLPS